MKENIKKSYMIYIMLFVLICAAVIVFLHRFTVWDDSINMIIFDTEETVHADGSVSPIEYDGNGMPRPPEENAYYRFSGTIPQDEAYDNIVLDILGADITLCVNGDMIFSSSSAPESEIVGQGQVSVPIPEGAEGTEIVVTFRPNDFENIIFPPMLRLESMSDETAAGIAYANIYGIPAGTFGAVFAALSGLFLLSIAIKRPNPSLCMLALTAAALTVHDISTGTGYYFLPRSVTGIFSGNYLSFVIPLLLIAYIVINARRGALKRFLMLTAASLPVFLAAYLISLAKGSYMSSYINQKIYAFISTGHYAELLHWITVYLVFACSAVAIYDAFMSFAGMKTASETLKLKSKMALESCRAAEKGLLETAALRHDMRKHLTALNLMCKNGRYDELHTTLDDLCGRLTEMPRTRFTANFVINSLLRSAAAAAAEKDIRFTANVSVPEKLNISDDDLCVIVMNLTDNAIEGSGRVADKDKRYIEFNAVLKQGYLSISCENSFDGIVNEGYTTRKESKDIHGLGIKQMRAIAKKYGGKLNITHTTESFTVKCALKNTNDRY